LSFVGRLRVPDINGEFDLQEFHILSPFHLTVHLNIRLLTLESSREADICLHPTLIADLRLRHNADLMGIVLDDLGRARRKLLSRVQVIDFYIPSLPVQRFVVEDDQLVGLASFGDNFSFSLAVIERGDNTTVDL
jgi:hypothetical protein